MPLPKQPNKTVNNDNSPIKNPFTNEKSDTPGMSWGDIMKPGKEDAVTAKRLQDNEHKRKTTIVIIVSIILALVIVGVFALVKVGVDNKNALIQQNLSAVQAPNQKVETKVKPDASSSYINLAENSSSVGEAAKGNTDGRVDGQKIILKTDNKESSFNFPAVKDKINGVTQACTLDKEAANCYLGEAALNDGHNVRFWAFRNAKTSSLLSTTSEPSIVGDGGASLAFTHVLDENGKKAYNLYIVLKNQTGVLVSTDSAASLDSVINGVKAFTVQQAD